MRQQFLENLEKDAKEFPYGKPKELRGKWEDLSPEDQADWNELAQSRQMQIYGIAGKAFELKQSHGIDELVSEQFMLKEGVLKEGETKKFRDYFKHFIEGHAARSRKGMEKKFGNKS